MDPRVRVPALAAVLLATGSGLVLSQPPARRVTTIAAIRSFPGFYHAQPVLVRGDLKSTGDRVSLLSTDDTLPVLSRERVPGDGAYDVRGEVLDIGRLTPDDPRLSGTDLTRMGVDVSDRWPRQGEVVVLRATGFAPAEPAPAPSIRAVAIDPHRYDSQRVTVAGQFRGANLYGDLPQAPAAAAESRHEFVLRSADAAIWILGRRPKGRGFEFDASSRIDTRRWLEVSGIVRQERGLAWIEAQELQEVEPVRERVDEPQPPPAPPVPPEVLFSAPAEGEIDVPPNSSIRLQFSRDLEAASLKGRVRVSYLVAESTERGEPQPPPVETMLRYDAGRRALEIGLVRPLERFRTVKVELLEGITGTDGAPLGAWTLTFTVGG